MSWAANEVGPDWIIHCRKGKRLMEVGAEGRRPQRGCFSIHSTRRWPPTDMSLQCDSWTFTDHSSAFKLEADGVMHGPLRRWRREKRGVCCLSERTCLSFLSPLRWAWDQAFQDYLLGAVKCLSSRKSWQCWLRSFASSATGFQLLTTPLPSPRGQSWKSVFGFSFEPFGPVSPVAALKI